MGNPSFLRMFVPRLAFLLVAGLAMEPAKSLLARLLPGASVWTDHFVQFSFGLAAVVFVAYPVLQWQRDNGRESKQ